MGTQTGGQEPLIMLESFFKPPVYFKVAEPWMWETPVSPAEEQLIERAVDKRKREFRAGRNASHALFNQLGIQHQDLLKGKQREPAWPQGWAGSISHTQGICMVVLASTQHVSSIGLDVELATPLNPELKELICRPEELIQINTLRTQMGTAYAYEKLIFSAKESVHKTYFPLNYHTLDFLDARIEIDWGNQTFQAFILNPEPQPNVKIDSLHGSFLFHEDWIVTTIVHQAPDVSY